MIAWLPWSFVSAFHNNPEMSNLYWRVIFDIVSAFLHVPNDYLRKRPLFARNLLGYNHAVWLAMNGDLEASYTISEKVSQHAEKVRFFPF